jgi:hypothetical protein
MFAGHLLQEFLEELIEKERDDILKSILDLK